METITTNTKALFIDVASVQDELSNLPQSVEYLVVNRLILDAPLNLPYGLKELHVESTYLRKSDLNKIIVYDTDEEEDEIDLIRNKLPFGCKLLKVNNRGTKNEIKTDMTRDVIRNKMMCFHCTNTRTISNNIQLEYVQPLKFKCEFSKDGKTLKYNMN
jgi:hypothetical protein